VVLPKKEEMKHPNAYSTTSGTRSAAHSQQTDREEGDNRPE